MQRVWEVGFRINGKEGGFRQVCATREDADAVVALHQQAGGGIEAYLDCAVMVPDDYWDDEA